MAIKLNAKDLKGVKVHKLPKDSNFSGTRLVPVADADNGKMYAVDVQDVITLTTAALGGQSVAYKGVATTSTNPSPTGAEFYTATEAGTYTNFLDSTSTAIVITANEPFVILSYDGSSWTKQNISTSLTISEDLVQNNYDRQVENGFKVADSSIVPVLNDKIERGVNFKSGVEDITSTLQLSQNKILDGYQLSNSTDYSSALEISCASGDVFYITASLYAQSVNDVQTSIIAGLDENKSFISDLDTFGLAVGELWSVRRDYKENATAFPSGGFRTYTDKKIVIPEGVRYISICTKTANSPLGLKINSYTDSIKGYFTKKVIDKNIPIIWKDGRYDVSGTLVANSKFRGFKLDTGDVGGTVRYLLNGNEYLTELKFINSQIGAQVRYEVTTTSLNFNVPANQKIYINTRRNDNADLTSSDLIDAELSLIYNDVNSEVATPQSNISDNRTFIADYYGVTPSNDSTVNNVNLQDLIDLINNTGGGTIKFLQGAYKFSDSIYLKTGVGIKGLGMGISELHMVGNSNFSLFNNKGFEWCEKTTFSDFTVDGYYAYPSSYSSDGKAFNMKQVKDCLIERVEVRGTPATGIGTDYLYKTTIKDCVLKDCGRLWTDGGSGGAGIGIGVFIFDDENSYIINNYVEGCGDFGIFLENQGIFSGGGAESGKDAKGANIINNVVINGRNHGIGLRGIKMASVNGNIIYGNAKNGIFVDTYLRQVQIVNNILQDNDKGIYFDEMTLDSAQVDVIGNLINDSITCGIDLNLSNCSEFLISNNNVKDSTNAIKINGNGDDIALTSNRFKSPNTAINIEGTQNDFAFISNILRGATVNTATFTGNNSQNEL